MNELVEYIEKFEKYFEFCVFCWNSKLRELGFRCCNFKKYIIIYEYISGVVNIYVIIYVKRNFDNVEI